VSTNLVALNGIFNQKFDSPSSLNTRNRVFSLNPESSKTTMAHVVTEKCNGCKFTDCVEVCPVACFYEMDTQVVIHADDCIDCMACVEVCPVHAIYADADVPAEYTKDIEFNSVEANQIKDSGAPAITVRKDALPTANDRKKALGY
jgi:ferredoxin